MRGDLVSRPLGEVMQEAENLVKAGVKELLVVSQDTSAYGVDVRYRTGFWQGRPVKTRMTELAARAVRTGRVGAAPLRLSVPARRRRDPADGGRPAAALPRRAVPAREPADPQADEAPGQRREHAGAHPRVARDLPGDHDPLDVHRGLSRRDGGRVRRAARIPRRGAARPRRLLRVFARRRRRRQRAARPGAARRARVAADAVHGNAGEDQRRAARSARSERRSTCWSTRSTRATSRIARSSADAPEIDGVVRVEGGGKLAVGAFARVRITGADAHDLSGRLVA